MHAPWHALSASPPGDSPMPGGAQAGRMYAVVACPRCRKARVVEQGRRSASCGSCGRPLAVADLRVYHSGPALEEAQNAAGMLNAKLAGREKEFLAAFVPPAPREVRHDDPWNAAAAAARKAESESDRADAIARRLSQDLGTFDQDDLQKAFRLAGIPETRAPHHLGRMLATLVLF